MFRVLFWLIVGFLFSQEKTIMPYDWSGHQGYVNIYGKYMWNQDWTSGPFFFDGTFASYPSLFGPEIESGFINFNPDSLLLDTSTVTSYFDYVQGDYYLDKLAIAAEYKENGRYCHLHGFKRTYAGAYNQYTPLNTAPRPIQQTYTAHYVSKKDQDEASVAIGYFNTNSGLPDTVGKSLIDSRITSSNLYWNHSAEPFFFKLEGNNFLQRYNTDHSMAITSQVRYLTRSRYHGSFNWKHDENMTLSFNVTANGRVLRDTLFKAMTWNELALAGNYSFLSLKTGIVKTRDQTQWVAKGSANFQWRDLSITAQLDRDVVPVHVSLTDSLALETWDRLGISGQWNLSKLSFTAWIFRNQYSRDLNLGNSYPPKSGSNIWIAGDLAAKLKETWFLSIQYEHQGLNGFISDGIGDRINIKILGQHKLFKGNLNLSTSLSLHGWLNREYRYVIHPVEFYPVNWTSDDDLMDKWFVNLFIIAQVRSFMLKYELHNVAQILNSFSFIDLGTSDFTLDVNPFFPPNRRLASLSLEWHFID